MYAMSESSLTIRQVAIYKRVSTEEQADIGYSLDAQDGLCRRYVAERGWTLFDVFTDPGRSGRTMLRPGFQAMMGIIRARRVQAIIVHKLDRLTRNVNDLMNLMAELEKYNVTLISVSEGMDFSTPMGRFSLIMMGAIAQLFVDNLSTETSKGLRQRWISGYHIGNVPFGYTTRAALSQQLLALGETFHAGGIVEATYQHDAEVIERVLERNASMLLTGAIPNPFTESGARAVFMTLSTGDYSLQRIATMLNERGFRSMGARGSKPFNPDTLREIVRNRFYIGEVQYKGEYRAGKHEALIDRDLFGRCQEVIQVRRGGYNRSPHQKHREYLLANMMECVECGCSLRGSSPKQTQRKYYDPAAYKGYVCSQPRFTDAERAEQMITAFVEALRLPADIDARIREQMNDQVDPHVQTRAALEAQLERMKQLYLMGDMAQGDYIEQRKGLRRQLEGLKAPTSPSHLQAERVIQLVQHLPTLWAKATVNERRQLLMQMFKRLYTKGGIIIAVEPTAILWNLLTIGDGFGVDGSRPLFHHPMLTLVKPGTPRATLLKWVA